jgi:hypothetical protein
MMTPALVITDLLGKVIEVTDIDVFIGIAKGGAGDNVGSAPFILVDNVNGQEGRFIPLSEYWQDALNKLYLLKAQQLWSELGDIPVNDDNEIEAAFLHFNAGDDTQEIWHWFESEFNLSVATDLMKLN